MPLTFIRCLMAWDRDAAAIRRLNQHDDRLLADMGLRREDIEKRVRGYPKQPQALTKCEHLKD